METGCQFFRFTSSSESGLDTLFEHMLLGNLQNLLPHLYLSEGLRVRHLMRLQSAHETKGGKQRILASLVLVELQVQLSTCQVITG